MQGDAELQTKFENLLRSTHEFLYELDLDWSGSRKTLIKAMAIKIFSHAITIGSLHHGTRLEFVPDLTIYDTTAASILTRTIAEAYSLVYSTFLESVGPKESTERFISYWIKALQTMRELSVLNNDPAMAETFLQDISIFKDANATIHNDPQELVGRKRKEGKRKMAMTVETLSSLGIPKAHIEMLYVSTSGSVHSDLYSLMQVQSSSGENSKERIDSIFYLCKSFVILILELMLVELTKEFELL